MKYIFAILIILAATKLGNAQSIDEDRIYATQFRGVIHLDKQLDINVTKFGNSIIHILESNDKNEITRELDRLSDSTFLYTEYRPMKSEVYTKGRRAYHVAKQGVLVFSNETVIDSSVVWNPETFETIPSSSPRKRNIFKPTGEWVEKTRIRPNAIKGSFNSMGKHGEWNYYMPSGELDKILTYENGELIKEDYPNYLHYESIDTLQEIIQRSWSRKKNVLKANFKKSSVIYTFEPDGTFLYTFSRVVEGENTGFTRKGTWMIANFKTVEITLYNKKKNWELEYLSDKKIRFKEPVPNF